jgi:hypothetical protein
MKENSKIQVPRINVVNPRACAASNFESNCCEHGWADHVVRIASHYNPCNNRGQMTEMTAHGHLQILGS